MTKLSLFWAFFVFVLYSEYNEQIKAMETINSTPEKQEWRLKVLQKHLIWYISKYREKYSRRQMFHYYFKQNVRAFNKYGIDYRYYIATFNASFEFVKKYGNIEK